MSTHTTIFPSSCTDGRYLYHIPGTALLSGANYDFFGSIVIFLLYFGYTKSNFRKFLQMKIKTTRGRSGVPRGLKGNSGT